MQTITTPAGEVLVILPLTEYQSLTEAADIAATDRIAAADEMVPADVVSHLIAGENPLRVWRGYRNMTTRDLAAKTGLSAPYLSEIETGKKEGSVAALKKLAEALALDIDDLVRTGS